MRTTGGWLRWFQSEWLLLIGLGLVLFFSIGLTRETVRRKNLGREIASLRQEAQQLRDRRQELQYQIVDSQDTLTQEREARLKLNLVRPGEKSLLIGESANQPAVTSPSETVGATPSASPPNPVKWWQYFFGV